jgi:DNA-3-methyladenine glycosylase I
MRCSWAEGGEGWYHDEEWGVPEHNDAALFELLTLEGAQSGLSWLTVLRKREGYRRVFANFNPEVVAAYTERDIDEFVLDPEIIRHRGKIESTINNARAIVDLHSASGTLNETLWSYVGRQPLQRDWKNDPRLPASTPESALMSKGLKKLGFRFVGPTTCYSLMQAAGLVNDHHPTCFRYAEVSNLR